MNFATVTYDVCRAYVRDSEHLCDNDKERILGWIRSRSFAKLASCQELLPTQHTPGRYRALYQVAALFKKNSVFADERITTAAALENFLHAEQICRIANKRLDYYYLQRGRLAPDLSRQMDKATAFVERVLGKFDCFLDSLPERIKFTAGATATLPRKTSLPCFKVSKKYDATLGAAPYLRALTEYFGYGSCKVRVAQHNRVEFVNKNWQTKRTIACEQTGNVPLQLAFDGYTKERLLQRAGIDLSDQSHNQEYARLASIFDHLATVDMRQASDTTAYNAVAWLFPQKWFEYLDSIRASIAVSGGAEELFQPFRYAKFSSMGNGTTFTIETLVFAACAHAVGSKVFKVYGDDVIIEADLVDQFAKLVHFLGYSLNHAKTHSTGPFRESCGANWFKGHDVTPFYVRKSPGNNAQWSHFVNGLASVAVPEGELWLYLRKLVKSQRLRLVPFNGDSMSGVWIDVPSAYQENLLTHRRGPREKFGPFEQRYLAYKAKTSRTYSGDTRSLFLWHHQKWCRGLRKTLPAYSAKQMGRYVSALLSRKDTHELHHNFLEDGACVERSVNTLAHGRYHSQWVHWVAPSGDTPPHLYWWGTYLTAPN